MNRILVTGSSGFVASRLIPLLKSSGASVVGIDRIESANTDLVMDICDFSFEKKDFFDGEEFIIINLAAARSDYGLAPQDYLVDNVKAHQAFFYNLDPTKVQYVVHMSSVAAFDGADVLFSYNIGSDDAYRYTKFQQSSIIESWCENNGIRLAVICPSAIYDSTNRIDTNIGVLKRVASLLPVVPHIDVFKTVTNLDVLSDFIIQAVREKTIGKIFAVDWPIKSVTDLMREEVGEEKIFFRMIGLKWILFIFSYIFLLFGVICRRDLKLYPHRVRKLYSDTRYLSNADVNKELYRDFHIAKILGKI